MILRPSCSYRIAAICLLLVPCVLSLPQSTETRIIHPSLSTRLRGGGLPFPSKSAVCKSPLQPIAPMDSKNGSISTFTLQIGIVIIMSLVTLFSRPSTLTPVGGSPSILHVFHYGWVAALSTGLGALPLLFLGKVSDLWLGFSNAIAAGMMLSASFSLMEEGVSLEADGSKLLGYAVSHHVRVVAGFLLGMSFVVLTKRWVERHEDLKFGDLKGKDLSKVFLMIAVMTLHSFSEGLGIGVAFTGRDGAHLGAFITASLAMHNVPEGLAVALVLLPRGMTKFSTVLWSIFTSMPQPLIAVPVFMFARHFIFWRSVGLGFAAGSMVWVTCFELIADTIKELSVLATVLTTGSSVLAGHLIRNYLIRDE